MSKLCRRHCIANYYIPDLLKEYTIKAYLCQKHNFDPIILKSFRIRIY